MIKFNPLLMSLQSSLDAVLPLLSRIFYLSSSLIEKIITWVLLFLKELFLKNVLLLVNAFIWILSFVLTADNYMDNNVQNVSNYFIAKTCIKNSNFYKTSYYTPHKSNSKNN